MKSYISSILRSRRHKPANWSYRMYIISAALVYPFQSAAVFHTQYGWSAYITVAFVVFGGILVNFTFLKDLISFFTSHRALRDLYKEYAWIAVVALLNISVFATLYHMFGISHGDTIIYRDWYNSYYFSVVTWTTLGYGDFSPVESLRLVAAFEAFLGYVYMAILVGLLLNLSQRTTNSNTTASIDD